MKKTSISYMLLILFSIVGMQNMLFGQDELMYITVALPDVKNKSNKNVDKRIQIEIERAIVESTGIARLVERDNFEDLQNWHNMLSAIDNSLVSSSKLKGADFLLKTKFLKFEIKAKNVGKIMTKRAKSEIEFELINIETGEVANTYTASPSGYYWANDKTEGIYDVLDDFNACLRTVVKYMLLQFSQTRIEIINLSKNKDGKVKYITIEGGLNGPYYEKLEMDIMSIYYSEFQGEKIKRNKIIGSCTVKKIYDEYSICEIKSGNQNVLAEIEADKKLYCIPKNLKPIDSCDGKLETKEDRNRLSKYVKDALGN